MKKRYADQEIIQGISSGGMQQEIAIRRLYEQYFHLTYDGRRKYHQLSEDDLITAYNSAIISLRKHVLNGSFRGESTLWTYLNRIFFNKCIDIIRKHASNRVDTYEEIPDRVDSNRNILTNMTIQEDFQLLLDQLDNLGEPCKQIILDSEYKGYNSEEIAERVGFSNAKSVNSKKYTCLQKLRQLLDRAFSQAQKNK